MDVFFKTEALLLRLWNSVHWTNVFPYLPQSRADQQWVGHRFLPEVWLWDHWNKKELLQEDRASRRPRVAEEPSQPVCATKRRASKGRVGAQAFEESTDVTASAETELWQRPPGSTRSTLCSKDAKRQKQIYSSKKICCIYFAKRFPFDCFFICYFTPFFI